MVPAMAAKVEQATSADIPAISLTLAKAFADDPVMAILFGGHSVPERPATRFFEMMAGVQLGHGHVYSTAGHQAAAIWAPPGHWRLPLGQVVKNAPTAIRVFGRRFVTSLRVLNVLEKNHPHEPHYYLEFIGTDPGAQGKGLGTALMQPMIDRCDEEGVGAYLESSKESNVGFYARFGFEVRKTITHKAGPQQWLMWRDPK
jgi:ribosomal protein S18 acetylase RimI-like enzyme